jgi:hypothetical protein
VRVDLEADCFADPLERVLQSPVGERLDLAAALTDEMVVVVAARRHRLVAGRVRELEPLDELEARELVESTVDAGEADLAVLRPQRLEDLVRGQTALLSSKERDHVLSCASCAPTRAGEAGQCMCLPGAHAV